MMPPPDIPRQKKLKDIDNPKKLIGNNARSVRRCDRQGVTHGNPTKDIYMAVGKRMLKYADVVKMFPGKYIPSMMSSFKAPHNFKFSVCVDQDHGKESIRAKHQDFKSYAHNLPAGYETGIKHLFVWLLETLAIPAAYLSLHPKSLMCSIRSSDAQSDL